MWVENIDPYEHELLVLVGMEDKKALFRFLKKIHALPKFAEWLLKDFDSFVKDLREKNKGQFCWSDTAPGHMLMLRPYQCTWDYWETLIHELHHVVQKVASLKVFLEEKEAQAYLQEHLFHSIRRKLQGIEKIT